MGLLEEEKSGILFTVSNVSIINGVYSTGKPDGSFMRFAVKVEKNYEEKGVDGRKKGRDGSGGSEDTGDGDGSEDYGDEVTDDDEEADINGRLTLGFG